MLGSTIKKTVPKKSYQGLYKSAADYYGLSSEQFFKGLEQESLNINYIKHGGQNALWYSNLIETEILISKGIIVNQLTEDKENALFSNINLSVAKLNMLININQQNYIGRTALFNRNKEITEMLYNANIDLTSSPP